jgi:hypothetical protein
MTVDMTQNTIGLGKGFSATLVCPKDRGPLYKREDSLECGSCGSVFPLVRGVPILINDENSVFAVADYVETPGYEGASYARDWDRVGRGRRLVRKIFKNFAEAPSSLRHLSDMEAIEIVRRECPQPRILVVGSGGRGHGGAEDRITAMDVAFGPGVEIIADAHDLPFPDGAFDLVIAIAVLEHVASPPRCVEEFWRVLQPNGYVYAITPFLQPVHMGAYDFTRFTPLGHRRLFRRFDAIEAGPALGVGTVAAWILCSFLESIPAGRYGRNLGRALGLLVTPGLRKLDRWLSGPSYMDAAGGVFFWGRRREEPIPDRLILKEYQGGFAR